MKIKRIKNGRKRHCTRTSIRRVETFMAKNNMINNYMMLPIVLFTAILLIYSLIITWNLFSNIFRNVLIFRITLGIWLFLLYWLMVIIGIMIVLPLFFTNGKI